jgi:hypothetical protein
MPLLYTTWPPEDFLQLCRKNFNIMPVPALSHEKGRGPDVYGQSEKRLTNPL